MIELTWDEPFTRILKKWRKKHPELVERFQRKLTLFKTEPFHPSLKTHSLSGNLAGSWAISINYEQRLVFKFLSDTKVLLIAILALTMKCIESWCLSREINNGVYADS